MLKLEPPDRFPPPHVIVVVHPNALVREGVRRVVEGLVGAVTCVEAADGDTLALALQRHPTASLVVLDLGVPRLAGGARLATLAGHFPMLRIVVIGDLTPHEAGELMRRVPAVMACLPPLAPLAQLRAGLEAALSGRALTPSAPGRPRRSESDGLTARQAEILGLLRQGLSNKVIAARLGIAEGTVKNHVSVLLHLLKVRNRTQAARQPEST